MEAVCKANDRDDLHRWVDDDSEWACCASDHGPFCRRCKQVTDEITRVLLDHVEVGWMQVWDGDEFQFKLTEAGRRRAEELIEEAGGET